jgi:hypothetical protein
MITNFIKAVFLACVAGAIIGPAIDTLCNVLRDMAF